MGLLLTSKCAIVGQQFLRENSFVLLWLDVNKTGHLLDWIKLTGNDIYPISGLRVFNLRGIV